MVSLALNTNQYAHAYTMVSVVHARGLPKRAAVILIETALVESSLQVYANSNIGESLGLPHEAVGSDHASVGPLQQQVPSWGSIADCMDPAKSAGKFLDGAGNNPGLLTLPGYRFDYVGHPHATSWDQIPTGAAAQAVQVSAFPDRYQAQEARATQIVEAIWGLGGSIGGIDPEDDSMSAAEADRIIAEIQSRLPLARLKKIDDTAYQIHEQIAPAVSAIRLAVLSDDFGPDDVQAIAKAVSDLGPQFAQQVVDLIAANMQSHPTEGVPA